MFHLLIFLYSARAACPEDSLGVAVRSADALDQAYLDLDDAGFDEARLRLGEMVPCISAVVSASDAEKLHAALGLAAFVESRPDDARRAFATVRVIDPDWTPPDWMPPPLRELALAPHGDGTVPLAYAPAGGWRVDGEPATFVPDDRAWLLQAMGGDGAVMFTRNGFQAQTAIDLASMFAPEDHRRRNVLRAVGSGTAVALVGSAGLMGAVAAGARRDLQDNPAISDVHGLRSSANRSTALAAGLGGTGIAVAAVAWSFPW